MLDFAVGRVEKVPVLTVATEGRPSNVAKATSLLRPRGEAVAGMTATYSIAIRSVVITA